MTFLMFKNVGAIVKLCLCALFDLSELFGCFDTIIDGSEVFYTNVLLIFRLFDNHASKSIRFFGHLMSCFKNQ